MDSDPPDQHAALAERLGAPATSLDPDHTSRTFDTGCADVDAHAHREANERLLREEVQRLARDVAELHALVPRVCELEREGVMLKRLRRLMLRWVGGT